MSHRPLPNLHLILAPESTTMGSVCMMLENGTERQLWTRTTAHGEELDYINLARIAPGEHVYGHEGKYLNDASFRWLTMRLSTGNGPQPGLGENELNALILQRENANESPPETHLNTWHS